MKIPNYNSFCNVKICLFFFSLAAFSLSLLLMAAGCPLTLTMLCSFFRIVGAIWIAIFFADFVFFVKELAKRDIVKTLKFMKPTDFIESFVGFLITYGAPNYIDFRYTPGVLHFPNADCDVCQQCLLDEYTHECIICEKEPFFVDSKSAIKAFKDCRNTAAIVSLNSPYIVYRRDGSLVMENVIMSPSKGRSKNNLYWLS